ncbi:class I SAM-dependent methyltransferase [Candidatus Ruminimicrobiellum ovillum]|uniref:class I SAM-dependent methyltransferase n=1 Tax=Candidatus Ruminimicrobiellum ovillum TaxID=1947927 RepID=UPI00355A6D36
MDDLDIDSIPIDPFWNVGDEQELKIHRIHAYPAKFPAFITTKALAYVRKYNFFPNKIGDIFCGCGTTACEARRNNIDFWGCDINPVATLIAEVKSHSFQKGRLEKYYNEIIKIYSSLNRFPTYETANPRLQYWYKETQYNDLSKLKESILIAIPNINSIYRKFFLCAFSNILKPASKWLAKSIKPQLDKDKLENNIITLFSSQFKFMLNAMKEVSLEKETNANSTIKTGSILNYKIKIPKVDMIITSPPYVTSYEYADLHQLSSLWLDFTEDYRELRKGTIGSVYHTESFSIKDNKNKLNVTAQNIVDNLEKKDRNKAKSVMRYFYDMQNVIRRTINILNNKGMAFFVIGNTKYKGIKIDNVKHLYECMKDVGFSKFYIAKRKITNKILSPYRDQFGKFTYNKKSRKIYSEEFILIGEK